ncbi:MAG: hypothetical protein KBF28_05510 [Gemmatimonadales bacterium]|nr:hypothetical protein [Gemmatimonadales bacterium]
MTPRRWLRTVAILIALLGFLDPSVPTQRFARAEVRVVATNSDRDALLVASVVRRLSGAFRVVVGEAGMSDATILVGDRLPRAVEAIRGPLVAVMPSRSTPWLAIEHVAVPSGALRDERVDVTAQLRVVGAKGRAVNVALQDGAHVVARTSVTPATADERLAVALPYVATKVDAVRLRIVAEVGSAAATAADLLVEVRDTRRDVLAFDLRPSWQATFVRRALEADARLAVTSRVVASPGITRSRGSSPTALTDLATIARHEVLVIGAPGLLSEREIAAIEGFLRERGGRVVLLLEAPPAGPLLGLVGGSAWRQDSSGRVVDLAADSSLGRLRGASFLFPARLPRGAEVIAWAGEGRPAIWRRPVGGGEVVVVGALDSWQRRAPTESDFGRFWPALVAGLAASAPPPIEIGLSQTVLQPGDSTRLTVTLRDIAAGRGSDASVAARLVGTDGGRTMVRLWPGRALGTLEGTVRATTSGPGRIEVRWGADSASVPMLVDAAARSAAPGTADLVSHLVAGARGAQLSGDNLARLPDVVHKLIGADPTPERWHPMRSPWWILPFALLLATEWWLRRRAGDA